MSQTRIKILATGGTIDKVYFDEKSIYEVGEPQIGEVLANSRIQNTVGRRRCSYCYDCPGHEVESFIGTTV